MTGWFFGGLALGLCISYVFSLIFKSPTNEYNIKKLKAKNGGVIDVDQNIVKPNKIKKDGIFRRIFRRKRVASDS